MDKTDALRATASFLAPLVRLAAVVASSVVLARTADASGVDVDVLALLASLAL